MLKSSKGIEPQAEAGFTLVETLVALAGAAVFLPVLSQGFGMAWSATHIADDAVSGMTLARALAAGLPENVRMWEKTGVVQGFGFSIAATPLRIETLPSPLPPAPGALAEKLASAAPRGGGSLSDEKLLCVTIIVTAPSGRRVRYETVKRENVAN
jgi:hypothetical protein